MHLRPLPIGLILFGLLVLGGTLDGVRRQFMQEPLWVTQNWRSVLKGMIGWLAVGGLALIAGVVVLLL
ncbi:hypothetical protein [Phenylobacterium sp.]|uniref:hypothetical protein n=1 Tax=Phenylobacterium sp. TaxID=1871053 RepID=UPI002F420128